MDSSARHRTAPLVLEHLPPRLPANGSLVGDWLLAGLFAIEWDVSNAPIRQTADSATAAGRYRTPKDIALLEGRVEVSQEVRETSTEMIAPHAPRLLSPHPSAFPGVAAASPDLTEVVASTLPREEQPVPFISGTDFQSVLPHGEQPAASFSRTDWKSVPPARFPLGSPPSGGLSSGPILPSQYIAKHYSEALGRLPDPGGWQSSHDFFARNGCHFDSLKTWGRSVYRSEEFGSFPYDNAARLLAAYRGILSREPDEGFYWSLSLLDKGYDWSAVVDTLYDSEEFQSWAPWICTGYSYSFGGTPVLWLPPGEGGFQGGTGRDLQEIIDRTPTGGMVFLAQKSVVLLDEPLILSRRITLTTVGAPPHNHYALMGRLVRNANFNEAAVKLRDGARLLNVWVDGARNYVGYRQGAINVQLFGGNGTTVADSVISNTAGWSSLQAFGSAEGQPCASNTLVRNLVTVYSSDHFDGTWADGLSVACENTLVQDNEIVDATDVPIVLFRSTPAVQRSQVRNNRILNAGNSAYGALVADPLRSGQTHSFAGSVVENNTFWTGPNTWYVVGISVGTRAWFGTQSDMGHGARFVNNTTGSDYALVNTGIGVSGMRDATVQGNGGQLWVYPFGRCPPVEVGASVSAGYASGDLQAYTDVLIQGCVGY